jgi:exodeoxyribonuclease VII large subunit
VVTGIGHEPDNSIADMVSDRRASTPTAAAEAVVPDVAELEAHLQSLTLALAQALRNVMRRLRQRVANLTTRPVFTDPQRLTAPYALALEQTGIRLRGAIPRQLQGQRHTVEALRQRVARAGGTLLAPYRRDVAVAAAKLESLSPLSVLARGYAITYAANGRVVARVADAAPGDAVSIRLQDGYLSATVGASRPLGEEQASGK